jgi:hypothetical protein
MAERVCPNADGVRKLARGRGCSSNNFHCTKCKNLDKSGGNIQICLAWGLPSLRARGIDAAVAMATAKKTVKLKLNFMMLCSDSCLNLNVNSQFRVIVFKWSSGWHKVVIWKSHGQYTGSVNPYQ